MTTTENNRLQPSSTAPLCVPCAHDLNPLTLRASNIASEIARQVRALWAVDPNATLIGGRGERDHLVTRPHVTHSSPAEAYRWTFDRRDDVDRAAVGYWALGAEITVAVHGRRGLARAAVTVWRDASESDSRTTAYGEIVNGEIVPSRH